jgi:hypothetical protein
MAIALLVTRNHPFFRGNLKQLFLLAIGRRVGDFLPRFLTASREHAFTCTLFAIARSEHRRDANYLLEEIAPALREALRSGCRIGLHGSYRSVVENADLKSEADALEAAIGVKPRGGRQHWLRFDRHDKLFGKVEEAEFVYDSTLGFSHTVGFRNGACFAFPPYDFEREEPYPFLEIPLAVMDSALSRYSVERAARLTDTVLQESRARGWGGIALLWHNPFEPLAVSEGVNRIFWEQLKTRAQHQECWMSAEDFLALSLTRYQRAGLLKRVDSLAHAANC